MPRKPRSHYDAVWKEALRLYFPDFIQFFLPTAYAEIDWSQPPEFLEQELHQIARRTKIGKLAVDKLVKVKLLAGVDAHVFVHVEVQSQPDPEFNQRMFLYNVELYRRRLQLVCSIAIFAGATADQPLGHFGFNIWGCSHDFRFPIVALAAFKARWSKLEASTNPFALVVMAHLRSQETQSDSQDRLRARLQLVRLLRKSHRSKEETHILLGFLEGLMALTDALESELYELEKQEEGEEAMELTTYAQRLGREEGYKEGREEGIQEGNSLAKIDDVACLEEFYMRLVRGASLEELRQLCTA
jgi:hypothetical protein